MEAGRHRLACFVILQVVIERYCALWHGFFRVPMIVVPELVIKVWIVIDHPGVALGNALIPALESSKMHPWFNSIRHGVKGVYGGVECAESEIDRSAGAREEILINLTFNTKEYCSSYLLSLLC